MYIRINSFVPTRVGSVELVDTLITIRSKEESQQNVDLCRARKKLQKVSPKVVCHFLSDRLEI